MNSQPKRTSPPPESNNEPTDQHAVSRRDAIKTTLAVAGATAFGVAAVDGAEESKSDERRVSPKRYAMKKSINLWAFPYPQRIGKVIRQDAGLEAQFVRVICFAFEALGKGRCVAMRAARADHCTTPGEVPSIVGPFDRRFLHTIDFLNSLSRAWKTFSCRLKRAISQHLKLGLEHRAQAP